MSDHVDLIDRLLEEADALGHGPSQVSLLEEAVRLADTHGDVEQGFRARLELTEAATFGGRPDLLLVAFSWCLAQHDRDPDCFEEESLLWQYKWVVDQLPDFPQIGREQIDAMFADMAHRFEQAGSRLHAVYHKRRYVSTRMGDVRAAAAANAKLARTSPDWLSDCPACKLNDDGWYLAFLGKDKQALAKVGPILQGKMECAEVPHITYGWVLLALVRLERWEEAMSYHRKGYRLLAGNSEFLEYTAQHLIFLCLTDNLAKAVKLLETHLPEALEAPSWRKRFEFYLACRFLLERLAERSSRKLRLRLPKAFALHHPKSQYAPAELSAWFGEQLQDLAGRFDARNGNDYFSRRIAGLEDLKQLIRPYPLRAGG